MVDKTETSRLSYHFSAIKENPSVKWETVVPRRIFLRYDIGIPFLFVLTAHCISATKEQLAVEGR